MEIRITLTITVEPISCFGLLVYGIASPLPWLQQVKSSRVESNIGGIMASREPVKSQDYISELGNLKLRNIVMTVPLFR